MEGNVAWVGEQREDSLREREGEAQKGSRNDRIVREEEEGQVNLGSVGDWVY